MDPFSTREIAVGFWTCVVVVAALSVTSVREALWVVVKQALLSKLILVWLSLAAYTGILVLVLGELGLWSTEIRKETLIWFAFSALAYPLQFHDPQESPRVLRVLLRDSISVLIVLEILVDTYTFSLPVELVLVPIVTVIALMGAVAELRDEHKPVARLFGTAQAGFGFLLIAVVVIRAVGDPGHQFLGGIFSSLIGVVLGVACWPYIQALRLALAHEGMLWRIGWKKDVSRWFKHYAAFRVLRYLKFRPTAVSTFIRRNAFELFDVGDRSTLDMLLHEDRQSLATSGREPAA